MSGPERLDFVEPTTRNLKRKHFSEDDQDHLGALDGIFKRIKTKAQQPPYILTTPSLNPYRYHSQQEANAWLMGRLWRPEEEHKQYRTFLYREPTCDDCFELQAGEEEPEPERERDRARAKLTADGRPLKKKPDLSAFRLKRANGTVTPGVKTSSPVLAPTKQGAEKYNGVKVDQAANPTTKEGTKSPRQHAASSSLPAGPTPEKQSSKSKDSRRPESAAPENPPLASRKRAPSQNNDIDRTKSNDHAETSNGTPHGLPRLLSPVPEPMTNPYGLPNILSPTLPANIQAELDRLEEKRKRSDSNTSSSSSDRKSQALAAPSVPKDNVEDTPKPAEAHARSVSTNGKSPAADPVRPIAEEYPSLIVKFKFSKTKVPTVKQILKLPPKRPSAEKKERPEVAKDITKEEPTKPEGPVIKKKPIPKVAARRGETTPMVAPSVATKSTSTSTKVPEKRPRPVDDEMASSTASKRPRTLSNQDCPVTPAQPSKSSPSLSIKSSVQKNQAHHTTPKKDAKAVNMLRTVSSESYDVTPGRSGGTPVGAKLDGRAGPTSAPSSNKKSADIPLLAQTSMKLNQMGRALKHEATKILTSAGSKLTRQDEKRAAVTNLECILSYMAAYYAQDYSLSLRGRAGEVEQTWKTLLPLCLSYARSTKDFQHLDGLRSYLSFVIAAAICTHVSQRGSNTRAHDSPQDIPHPELAKQHTTVAENFALLADHTLKMNRHYQDARIALPLEDLQSTYKKTYAARETNLKLARDAEKISGTRMTGPYFLPLSLDTTPIQAVRFGLKFLSEYCDKEKLDYSFRVNLEKPE